MGIDELSMSPAHILKIRDTVCNIDLSDEKNIRITDILNDNIKTGI